ncbi:hypothetical protein ASG36_18640 [Geodermatophilus sp. Leaf369]|uniref:aldo/keto reductase n=1 Tax=Geodermatophilus sp. Leaf369 TaxID=1736354 RepID=UPI0006FAAC04|nr:aldo/keto reductase [Geodermatophilus sp. Leaf369]KQS57005.1 hypothetical protein ASG36_18640 [Geodermatophilus sp. Leaf369]
MQLHLRSPQTDHIDRYQIHHPSLDTEIEEPLDVLTDMQRARKIRCLGSSTFLPSRVVQAQWVASVRQSDSFFTEQPPYAMLVRGIERQLLPGA